MAELQGNRAGHSGQSFPGKFNYTLDKGRACEP